MDGIHCGTIFVYGCDTDDRYIVDGKDWMTVGYIGDGKNACIKNFAGAVACLADATYWTEWARKEDVEAWIDLMGNQAWEGPLFPIH